MVVEGSFPGITRIKRLTAVLPRWGRRSVDANQDMPLAPAITPASLIVPDDEAPTVQVAAISMPPLSEDDLAFIEAQRAALGFNDPDATSSSYRGDTQFLEVVVAPVTPRTQAVTGWEIEKPLGTGLSASVLGALRDIHKGWDIGREIARAKEEARKAKMSNN